MSGRNRGAEWTPARDALPSDDPRPIARLLIDSVQGISSGAYPWEEIDPDRLLLAALQHGVTPAAALALRGRQEVPSGLADRFHSSYRDQMARHFRTLADLAQASEVLDSAGLPWAVMKGPALAEQLWPRPDMRLYVDLDLIVDRRSLSAAIDALVAAGATMVDRNWPMIRAQMRGEIELALPYGTPLDLHWHVVNDAALRQVFTFDMDALLSRTAPARLGRVVAPVLDPVDTVLHLAYHMAHSGGHKLVWLKDFDLAANRPNLDWDEVRRRSPGYGCDLALDSVIRRTERVLWHRDRTRAGKGRPSVWGLATSLADRWRPPPHLPGERGSGRIVFQATRGSTLGSLSAGLSAALHRPPPVGRRAANPLHRDVNDASAREGFFRELRAYRP